MKIPFGPKAAWWGHPITSGIESIDFFFSLDDELPAADSHYSEQLVRFDTINTMNLRVVCMYVCMYVCIDTVRLPLHDISGGSLAERVLQERIVQQGRSTRECEGVHGPRPIVQSPSRV